MTPHIRPTNTQLLLARRPRGFIQEDDPTLATVPVAPPGPGELLVEVKQISLDPAMRSWLNDVPSYIPPVALGAVMRAFAVGEVVASHHEDFAVGDLVTGEFGAQEYAISDGTGVDTIDPTIDVPTSAYLGILGLTGITAYFGLLEIGEFRPGQTVLVSGAAGAVGSTVGQIVKTLGGTVIGTAGGPAKCAHLVDTLGFDGAVDYREPGLGQALRELAPDGFHVFFDNVGGDVLDAGLANLRVGARVVICGAISQYNATAPAPGPGNYRYLLTRRARMEGLIVFDYVQRYREAMTQLAAWLSEGRLQNIEDIAHGSIADFPATLMRLYEGRNTGKLVLQLDHP